MPLHLFKDIIDENDLVIVLLEHMDYYCKLHGKHSPFGYAAYSLAKMKKPISEMKNELRGIKGIGEVTESVIKEILETGSSGYYRKLMKL